jgi:hypothetical protein
MSAQTTPGADQGIVGGIDRTSAFSFGSPPGGLSVELPLPGPVGLGDNFYPLARLKSRHPVLIISTRQWGVLATSVHAPSIGVPARLPDLFVSGHFNFGS